MAASPIADLSYRNYDGPLESPRWRWWVIAKMTMRLAVSKKSLWVATAFSGWYYLAMMFTLFVFEQIMSFGNTGPANMFFSRIVWKDQFLHGFSFAQLLMLTCALIIGAGAIANDNRANALLVYLSKPCSKFDYVFGKWVGVFIPLVAVLLVPSLIFYFYGALTYRELGFVSSDPWLLARLFFVFVFSAAVHTSLVLAVSSMFKQGRVAGAVYAGIYFLGNFFTKLIQFAWARSDGDSPYPIDTLFYCSIDGVQIGLAKALLQTDGTPIFNMPSRFPMVPAPSYQLFLGITLFLIVAGFCVAWIRTKAVEVVG